ncbi:16S rRNA (cytosine(967)-C(5))-methyltransferase RsmB [Pseudoteredinibacter isoporae]|uniref:16S rRNA (cytosine(967)-C(5))-methyltransferase n=1 Tax=Pseudoteredinibacter isoporae TaxID=570281 RepID=A0A7X0JRT2_9GAMM|nr:16S rRNA (cytosine(967)-C(5))-methyltransferase RsmB [Pseudoteredinibacter isoporae]MBB6520166.1 16S rRNA (cytosine967-C5)-methyltransferase [Pseudoteredinibacter isoporae]NHO85738.1 16S rRNA (cytosine(967)-C(5))-methyltransferase RsmB [Pseudoteredinibacter isoporae]NIB25810.1 16S rRNA (cytosine(967)-C(5))-methyltransferase RsmB [Pseudoteredinibacter isoporae]
MALDTRAAAARAIAQVFKQQGSLASALPPLLKQVSAQDKGLLQELCYGSLRYFHRLNASLLGLLKQPLKTKDQDIQALLLIGCYQLDYSRIPPHAAVASCVEACRALKKPWACKLVNGVLRNYQRQEASDNSDQPWLEHSHPKWFYKRLHKAWPDLADDILQQNNQHPPFTLRLNLERASVTDYLALLAEQGIAARACEFSPEGITLEKPCPVEQLPHFDEGWLSVQDEAAQFSARLLELADDQHILDACCAPGGKTGHILELAKNPSLTAVDTEAKRLKRVEENLARLGFSATLRCADASDTEQWFDGKRFDRILLDAPCSATGVIRRHPDIKLLRKPQNIDELCEIQKRLLENLWPLLKPGGILLYATCSVLPEENDAQITQFLAHHADAEEYTIDAPWGVAGAHGRQLFPQANGHDGFYYARLQKNEQKA